MWHEHGRRQRQRGRRRSTDEHVGLLPAPPQIGLSRKLVLRGAVVAVVTLIAGLFVPTFITDPYYMGIVADGVVLGLLAVGIGFLAHRCGLISLGHTAFFGGAAYGVAIATTHWGWSPLTAALFAVVGGTVLAGSDRRAVHPHAGHGLPDADAGLRAGALPTLDPDQRARRHRRVRRPQPSRGAPMTRSSA